MVITSRTSLGRARVRRWRRRARPGPRDLLPEAMRAGQRHGRADGEVEGNADAGSGRGGSSPPGHRLGQRAGHDAGSHQRHRASRPSRALPSARGSACGDHGHRPRCRDGGTPPQDEMRPYPARRAQAEWFPEEIRLSGGDGRRVHGCGREGDGGCQQQRVCHADLRTRHDLVPLERHILVVVPSAVKDRCGRRDRSAPGALLDSLSPTSTTSRSAVPTQPMPVTATKSESRWYERDSSCPRQDSNLRHLL